MTPQALKHLPNLTDLTILSCIGNGLKTVPAISKETESTKTRIWNSVFFLADIGLIDVTDITDETKKDPINGLSRTEYNLTEKGQAVIKDTVLDFQKNYLISNKTLQ